jgi:hypothetical protein
MPDTRTGHLCREITCPSCGSNELHLSCCGAELGTRLRECIRCGPPAPDHTALLRECRDLIEIHAPMRSEVFDLLRRLDAALNETEK